jgi:plastocyanin
VVESHTIPGGERGLTPRFAQRRTSLPICGREPKRLRARIERAIEQGASVKRVLILATALVLAVAACSSDDGGSATTAGGGSATTAGGGEERVEIADLAFNPDTLTVPVGSTVTWENTDSLAHTSNSDDEVWDSGTLDSGDEFSFTFDEAGTFTYFCEIHPSMTGSIVVEG